MTQILVLVMATQREPWARYQQVQSETWGAELPSNMALMRYFKTGRTTNVATRTAQWREALRFGRKGRIQRLLDHQLNIRARGLSVPAKLNARGDLEVDVPDFIHWNGVATIAALRWALATRDDDYILRANSSAYINLAGLQRFVASRADTATDLYAGAVEPGSLFWGTDFVNGAAVLLSRSLVQRIVDNADAWDHRFTDDVSLGMLAASLGVRPLDMPVMRISTEAELDALTPTLAAAQVSIRLKSTELPRAEESRMRRVQALLAEASPA